MEEIACGLAPGLAFAIKEFTLCYGAFVTTVITPKKEAIHGALTFNVQSARALVSHGPHAYQVSAGDEALEHTLGHHHMHWPQLCLVSYFERSDQSCLELT